MAVQAPISRRWLETVILAVATLIAAASARPYAGGWNDGSRLATVESLIDHHTFAIDDSIYVRVPPIEADSPWPYDRNQAALLQRGTLDKLFIDGHFYSDKSPLPALLLAGEYALWRALSGTTARQRPDRFAFWMTLGSSGVGYVLATWCIFRIAALLSLAVPVQLLLTASFGLCTVALPYTRHVNNHMLLLGVAACLAVVLVRWFDAPSSHHRGRLLALGTLSGVSYGIDLAAGPLLLVCTSALVTWRVRTMRGILPFCLSALPWLALHHALNYAIGRTIVPANAVPAYFQFPGSVFDASNMTGLWRHSATGFCTYAAALLLGKRGFLGHNPTLLLAVTAPFCLRTRMRLPAVLAWAAAWCGGTWLLYAAMSTNSSGRCASVRWFVPLLAPAYLALALVLRAQPRYVLDLALLSAWGFVMAAFMWLEGPWMPHLVPLYWVWFGGALLSWLVGRRRNREETAPSPPSRERVTDWAIRSWR
jgi:hypothetical protein